LGLSLPAAGHPDDVQLCADRRGKAIAPVPTLPEGVYKQASQRCVLLAAVQEPA